MSAATPAPEAVEEVYRDLLARAPENRMEPRLEPMRRVLALLGDPQHAAPVIHLTGTNGKTSMARMIEAVLRAYGLRAGRYTSPHLEKVTERISVDGEPVADETFVRVWGEILPIVQGVDAELEAAGEPRLTYFEALTVLGFAVFADEPVEVVVLEVGLGGVTDATNVADAVVSVVTPISLDHTDLLGETEAEIADAARGMDRLIRNLHAQGARIPILMELVSALNSRIMQRLFEQVVPPEYHDRLCLLVMGSEGRSEQLLKTDQDNGLLLREGFAPPPDLQAICQRFSDVLESFGYPECPGGIMLSNPAWRGSVADFTQRVRQWLLLPEADSLMNLAIFLDAHAVAGDPALLAQVKRGLMDVATDSDTLVARFAVAVQQFDHAASWWNRLLTRSDDARHISLKKAGIFPIVHGVRSLALARRVTATSTAERIAALDADGTLDAGLGEELVQSLHFLMGLRLQAGLAEMDQGHPVTGRVDPQRLGSLERSLLKDALAVVKRFKAFLRLRLRLDAL